MQRTILVILLVMISFGCTKRKIRKQLIGDWYVTKVEYYDGTPGSGTGLIDFNLTSVVFNSDKTGTGFGNANGASPFPVNFTWSNDDSQVTITDSQTGISLDYLIMEREDRKLVLENTSTAEVAGVIHTYRVTVTIKKIYK